MVGAVAPVGRAACSCRCRRSRSRRRPRAGRGGRSTSPRAVVRHGAPKYSRPVGAHSRAACRRRGSLRTSPASSPARRPTDRRRRRAHRRQAAQLRADQEGVDAARRCGRDAHNAGSCAESSSRHRGSPAPKSAVDAAPAPAAGAARRASRPARRRIAGDAAAPGIGRLRARAGPWVRQRVAGRDVHHDERDRT